MNFKVILSLGLLSLIHGSTLNEINQDALNKYKLHQEDQKLNETEYKKIIESNMYYYESIFQKSLLYYTKKIGVVWGKDDIKLSSKTVFTQYDKNLNSRQSIDFENGKVILEILSNKSIDDTQLFQKKFNKLTSQNIEESFFKDPVNKVAINLLKGKKIVDETKIYNKDLLVNKKLLQKTKIKKEDIKHKTVNTKDGKKEISYVVIKMVPKYLQIKAKAFKDTVYKDSKRFDIQDSLVFGIMQTESYFNPLARSHIPAFGLMQIVPSSAGKDAYLALYGKRKILSPIYLYNSENNIEIGTKYIQIIQDNYLKGITDPKKLFYCTAAAYNAGIGSLYKSITGEKKITNFSKIKKEAIKKINKMSVDELYTHLTTSKRLTIEAQSYVTKVEKNSKNYLAWDR